MVEAFYGRRRGVRSSGRRHCSDPDLYRLWRADERTRTADLPSLRVRGKWLLNVAGVCKSRISKRFFVSCIAHYCRVWRAG